MSDAVQISLITMIGATLPSAVSAFFAYRASGHAKQAADTSQHAADNSDGMKDELVRLTAKSSHAEGVLEQKEKEG